MMNTGIRASSIIAHMEERSGIAICSLVLWCQIRSIQPGMLRSNSEIATYSRLEHGVEFVVFIQEQRLEARMDGRREARIVGLGITAVYVCLLLAALGSA